MADSKQDPRAKSPELEELHRLLAEVDAAASGGRPAPSPRPPPRRGPRWWLGILDLLAVSAAVYTLMVATPVGGLVVRGVHWATGRHVRTRPLITYFKTERGAGVSSHAVEAVAQAPAADASTTPGAKAAGLDPDLARALALMLSAGNRSEGHFDVRYPPGAAASFAAVGLVAPAATAPADAREAALLTGLGKLQADLHHPEAAVAALAVELPRVRYAVHLAKAAGAAMPGEYAAFREYLPPDDRAEADPVVHGTFALVTAFGMTWPVPTNARITSPFGWRVHPVLGKRKLHGGVDVAVPLGTDVVAIADGEVLYVAQDGVNGRFLKVDHGHGLTSVYCHNDSTEVRRGQRVKKGAVVAKSGASGRVTGPHLHFQMELDGTPVDPEIFLK
ncbi:MAG: M23 family metallopeptidase [Deltaproteobacteria bacterium]|nr:M23 family metallopeptidase [Deltaproteobacteria bacterium]